MGIVEDAAKFHQLVECVVVEPLEFLRLGKKCCGIKLVEPALRHARELGHHAQGGVAILTRQQPRPVGGKFRHAIPGHEGVLQREGKQVADSQCGRANHASEHWQHLGHLVI